ncbi:MAG: hypothetical protein HOW73_49410 [Polyangiaceae bacterium]|nr:hypothetical protein [Polyangiaceae bacterium]
MSRPRCFAFLLGSLIALYAGCQDEEPALPQVEGIYVVPSSLDELADETFFDHPFPSDLRMSDGAVRMAGWPNPKGVPLIDEYIGFIDGRLDGFSPVAAGFLRFAGPIDPAGLPDAEGSTLATSAVQLIDIDPASPEVGTRRPIYVTFRAEAGAYWQPNTLSFMPVPGYPLRPHTHYALVVTDALHGEAGATVVAPAALKEVLGLAEPSTPAIEAARSALEPRVSGVRDAGIDPERIVQFAAFTTNDPAEEYLAAAGAIAAQIEAPTADPAAWAVKKENATYTEYEGSYGPTPNYQAGEIPFTHFGDGGGFELDENGVPQVYDTFTLRFSLSIPNADICPMPADGYPIVLYAHGTTGSYRSYIFDGTAASLTDQCLAVMGVDQIFHGTRPGAPDKDTTIEILFFNFQNVEAARTNVRQSGLDEMQRARLFTETHMTLPSTIAVDGQEVRFDASKLMFFGHSQGSLNGPLFLAGNDTVRGAVLSGASAVMQITLLEKTKPEPSVAALVKTIFLQLVQDEANEVSLLYPPIALAQTIVDPVDPENYARYIVNEPVYGGPKSVYMTEGVFADGTGDSFAPPRGCEALATAIGLPFMTPLVHEPTDAVGEPNLVTIPPNGLSGNLADGAASGVLAQWQPEEDDGHFVVFDIPGATAQSAAFLRALADDAKGLVPAP